MAHRKEGLTNQDVFLLLLIFALFLHLCGCRSARKVVIEIPAGRSAINVASDTTLIDPPPLSPLPRFDLGLSAPLEVERFRRMREGRSFDVQRLIVDRTSDNDEIVIETGSARYRFRAPARGQKLEISNRAEEGADGSISRDSLLGSVEGEPKPERHEIEIEDPEGPLDRWIRLVKWVAVLIVLGIVALFALRFFR